VERIQSAHAAQVAELRVQMDSLRTANNELAALQQELYVCWLASYLCNCCQVFDFCPALRLLLFLAGG